MYYMLCMHLLHVMYMYMVCGYVALFIKYPTNLSETAHRSLGIYSDPVIPFLFF